MGHRLFIFFFLCILSLSCFGQSTISGRVVDASDNKPMPFVNVFLGNSMVGVATTDSGMFSLAHVKTGKYELIVSFIGFETYRQTLSVNGNINLPDIKLKQKVNSLKEVTIKNKEDPYRDANYQLFKNAFLGTSDLAQDCTILNPKILDLSYDDATSTLTASSYDFLQIENKALGYNIKYLLNSLSATEDKVTHTLSYKGDVLFTEMKGSPAEERRWKKARQEVYENSEMHFLRAAIQNKLKQEGFRVIQYARYLNPERPSDSIIRAKLKFFESKPREQQWKDSLTKWNRILKLPEVLHKLLYQLDGGDIVMRTDQPNVYALGCDMDELHITYNKDHNFPVSVRIPNLNSPNNQDVTMISFNSDYAPFDSNGWVITPESMTLQGVWARNRIAELLPIDYEPEATK